MLPAHNKIYLGLHVECPTVLSNFNQIHIFSTDFNKSLIPNFTQNLTGKEVERWTGKDAESKRHFPQLYKHT